MPLLQRDTLFKVARRNKHDQDRLIEAYQVLAQEAKLVCFPVFILPLLGGTKGIDSMSCSADFWLCIAP